MKIEEPVIPSWIGLLPGESATNLQTYLFYNQMVSIPRLFGIYRSVWRR
jgi:hypothetical protein